MLITPVSSTSTCVLVLLHLDVASLHLGAVTVTQTLILCGTQIDFTWPLSCESGHGSLKLVDNIL